MAKGKNTHQGKPDRLAALDEVLGQAAGVHPENIDATLLWMATVAVLRHGAALHLGTTRTGNSYVVTIYDGEYPRKQYFETEDDLHRLLAALVRVYEKGAITPEWAGYIQEFLP
jgi:hypothetical protein